MVTTPVYPPDEPLNDVSRCPGCKAPVTGRKRWCSEACRKRTARGTSPRTPRGPKVKARQRFIGVDGESVDDRYVLLAASDDDGWSDYVEPRKGERELRTADCLHFLATLPKGLVWGFVFSYDVNMMLKDLPLTHIRRLYDTGTVRWLQYQITYIPRKKLTVTLRSGAFREAVRKDSSTVWDMFPWQQSSFVTWLRDEHLAPPEVIARIESMKHQRADFTGGQRKEIIAYCLDECRYLATGARKMCDTIHAAGFNTGGRYYSPASLAKAKMKSEGLEAYMADPPEHLVKGIEAARFGGRAEVGQSGPIDGEVWQHDINSAYPTEMQKLPCLAHGHWVEGTSTPWALQRVKWSPLTRRPIWGPFPMRGKVGSLRFPSSGEGWYWREEVEAGSRISNVKVLESWSFVPGCDHAPFDYVPAMYAHRKALKAAGDPSEYVFKLALNSTYGALAERPSKGQKRPPRWRSLMWAGLITAGTRAKMLSILDDDVVMIATDAIYARKRLDVDEGTGLGQWEVDRYDSMWIAGTGFYFPFRDGEWLKPKTRGFSSYDIDRDQLIATWAGDGREGTYRDVRRRFIGMGTALHRIGGIWPPYERLWRHFVDEPVAKTFDLAPRRTWLTGNVHDGRSRAPSLATHLEIARHDVEHLARLRREVERDAKKYRATIRALDKKQFPWWEFPAFRRRLEHLMVMAAIIDKREYGDGSDMLPRGDQPMGLNSAP